MSDQRFDIAVVGGGMVGAALALALAQRDFSVVLLEARHPPLDWEPGSYDLRVSAISRASQHLLDNLGVWQPMVADRATAYRQMHVWDRAGFGEICFDAADLCEPDLGHIIENRVTVRALWQAFDATQLTVISPAKVCGLVVGEHDVELQLVDRSPLRVGLVVGADGARSQIRQLAGIGARSESYNQNGVVAKVHAEHGNRATAWQRFMPNGPLALLPIEDELFSIVWSTTPDEATRLCEMDESDFNDSLTLASEARLGDLRVVGQRAAFPLSLQHAEHYVQPGVALLGDAAHVVHPLAGQGVNLGLLDAGALVDALLAGRESGRPVGALRDLRAYERARKGHNLVTQLTMDAFKRLFSNDHRVLSLTRNLGLGLSGRVAPVRRLFERLAMGQGLELPKLSRPMPPR